MRLVTALFATLLAFTPLAAHAAEAPARESAYDRVMRTGTLRCGYILIPPEFSKDLDTGEFSGVAADVMNEIAKRLSLKIDWVEEVNFTTMGTGLQTGRYDAICFSLYRMTAATRVMAYTRPLFYSGTGIYVRADDHRFDDKPLTVFNSPDIRITTVDAEMSSTIARDSFPLAKTVSMPTGTDLSQLLLNIVDGKADVTFLSGVIASGFIKANPDRVRDIAKGQPLQIFSHGIAYAPQDIALGQMLNIAIDEMDEQGKLREIIAKHELIPGAYLRVARHYEIPGQ